MPRRPRDPERADDRDEHRQRQPRLLRAADPHTHRDAEPRSWSSGSGRWCCRFCSSPHCSSACRGSACSGCCRTSVRLVVAVAFALAALAALYPLRFFRKPSVAEIDRRIEAANRLEHNPVSVQSDRPGGRHGAFADALWREHQKRMAERAGGGVRRPAAHPRSRARPLGAARRGRAALRRRLRIFLQPARRQPVGCVAPAGRRRRHPAAHRRLGDAALLYRQGADLPHLQRQCGHRCLHRAGGQRGRAAGHRRRRRRDAELHRSVRQCARHRRAKRRSSKRSRRRRRCRPARASSPAS